MWEKTAMTLTLLTCCSVGSNLSGSQKKSSVSGSWRCRSICQSFLNVNEYRLRITFRLPWRNSSFCSEKTRRESEGFWKKIKILNPEMFLMLLSLAHDLADINSQLFLPAFHGVAGVWEASAGAPGETSVKIFWRRDWGWDLRHVQNFY